MRQNATHFVQRVAADARTIATADTHTVELVLICCSFSWTFALVWSQDTLALSSILAPMLNVLPENGWALVSFVAGALKVVGWVTRRRWLRLIGLSWGAGFWALVSTLIALTQWPNQGAFVYGTLSLASVWAAISLAARKDGWVR